VTQAILHIAIVAAGGAIGASLRHLVGSASLKLVGRGFPWSTLFVNIVGCLAMGVFIGLLARRYTASNEIRLFVATGILGGFTTFSAFSADFATLWGRGALLPAFSYGAASVLGSLCALFLGLWLARSLT